QEGLRWAPHAVVEGDAPTGVADDGPRAAELADEAAHVGGAVVEDHAQDRRVTGRLMALDELDQLRVLLATGHAPAGEEVDDHPLAPVVAERGLTSVQCCS